MFALLCVSGSCTHIWRTSAVSYSTWEQLSMYTATQRCWKWHNNIPWSSSM